MRNHQKEKIRNKKTQRHLRIINNSMMKHRTGPGIFKIDDIKVKTHPGTTTDDFIAYIKPIISQNQIFFNTE